MDEETKFQWAEGMKYALEGIKAIFVLNGAATVSILTFVGNTKTKSDFLVYAMIFFAIGTLTGPVSFCFAYLTQLTYGNSFRSGGNRTSGNKFHYLTYFAVVCGMLFFICGIAFAGFGFLESNVNLPK